VLFLAVPVDGIIRIIQHLPALPEKLAIIDLGSTKEKISQAIPKAIRANFVTAHPMTGIEQSGPTAAIEGLYHNKVVVLCDLEKSGVHQQTIAKKLFDLIETKLVTMDAKEHDRHAAYISHMPHALSYALANAVMKQEDNTSIVNLAGGGFKDMSRIAQSSPNMWEDIFRQNRTNLLEAIHSLQSELKKCEKMVEHEEWETLNNWMHEANKLHHIL
jgi:prephenate dehydrogenase